MSSCPEAKAILRPIFDAYCKAIEDQEIDKVANYYLPDAVLVHKGKNGWYGREAIKEEFQRFDELLGKSTTKLMNDTYQMTSDYIIISAGYETVAAKKGVVKGEFSQIWKKTGNSYQIYHDEFTME